jgi:hypothetical protein
LQLPTEPYLAQKARWPSSGRHILARYDDETIIVYQAFRPQIARFAVANGYFGDGFQLTRMSWIKPNFLWMMYRCGWAKKEGQERVLAVRLRRETFEAILAEAVPSGYAAEAYPTREAWAEVVAGSSVRLQWDPDHGPSGEPLERRAIQYAREWIVDIEDITDFVISQRDNAFGGAAANLLTPREDVYRPGDPALCARLGLY